VGRGDGRRRRTRAEIRAVVAQRAQCRG
jgi:hypothetical protein